MILGFLLLLLPGFLITMIFFNKKSILEKILYTFLISIAFSVIVGMVLGFNEFMFKVTGGVSRTSLMIVYVIVNFGLIVFYFMKKKKK
jgi:uncharacterized membrane protein